MNEFTAKKLGEVIAFCEVFLDTLEKGSAALQSMYTPAAWHEYKETVTIHRDSLLDVADKSGSKEIVEKKISGTGSKLRSMRDMYVGEEWDNPTELLEWSGFFHGAAVVHYALLSGAGTKIKDNSILELTRVGLELHHKLLSQSEELLHQTGIDRG